MSRTLDLEMLSQNAGKDTVTLQRKLHSIEHEIEHVIALGTFSNHLTQGILQREGT